MTARAFQIPRTEYTPVRHRLIGIVERGETLRCLRGHRLHDPLVIEHGAIRCTHRDAEAREVCGMLVYIVGGTLSSPRGKPLMILAEVTPEEVREMGRQAMKWDDALRFLGVYVGGEQGGSR